MTPFHGGNKIRPRINVTTGKTSFNWLFDTGAAITCMNADSFREAFGHLEWLKRVLAALQQMGLEWNHWAFLNLK